MTSEADEHEQALALEIGYQRRQWDKLHRLEKQMEKQDVKIQELECQLQVHRQQAQIIEAGLVERCNEEHGIRQTELHGLRESIKALGGKLDGMLREAERDLADSHQKRYQELRSSFDTIQRQHEDLVEDLGGRCKDLECLFKEEFRNSVADLERRSGEMIRETAKDLSKLVHSKHQEHAERVWCCTERFADLGREVAQDRAAQQHQQQTLRSALGEVERKCSDLVCSLVNEVGEKHALASCRSVEAEKRVSHALKELASRVDDIEHDFATHTHQFTLENVCKCSPPLRPAALSPPAKARDDRLKGEFLGIPRVPGAEM